MSLLNNQQTHLKRPQPCTIKAWLKIHSINRRQSKTNTKPMNNDPKNEANVPKLDIAPDKPFSTTLKVRIE